MTIKQTADTLTIETEGRNGPQTRTYKLDGSETEITMGQMTAKVQREVGWQQARHHNEDRPGRTGADPVHRRRHPHHRPHRRPGPLEDHLQEDHVVRTLRASHQLGPEAQASGLFCIGSCPSRVTAAAPPPSFQRPDPGDRHPPPTSGPSTKNRPRNRGCGTVSPSSSTTSPPASTRSRSRVRGAPGYGRSRPNSRSMSRSSCRRSRAGRSDSPTMAAFR